MSSNKKVTRQPGRDPARCKEPAKPPDSAPTNGSKAPGAARSIEEGVRFHLSPCHVTPCHVGWRAARHAVTSPVLCSAPGLAPAGDQTFAGPKVWIKKPFLNFPTRPPCFASSRRAPRLSGSNSGGRNQHHTVHGRATPTKAVTRRQRQGQITACGVLFRRRSAERHKS